jgi:hypothetical protein
MGDRDRVRVSPQPVNELLSWAVFFFLVFQLAHSKSSQALQGEGEGYSGFTFVSIL